MSLIQIVGAADFIDELTRGQLLTPQINRAVAYLRAKGIAFYDNFSKEHCIIHEQLTTRKIDILNALRYTLK